MELTIRFLIDAVIAGSRPVAVTIGQGDVDCQKPKRALDVEDWFQFLFQLVVRGLVQDFAQLNQSVPRFLLILRFDLKSLSIRLDLITQVPQAPVPLWAATHFPPGALGGVEVFFDENFVELL